MPDDITENDAPYSPYLAAIEGRDADAQQKFFERFAQQPQEIRHFIASPDTAATIKQLVDSEAVPVQYGVAIAKMVALLAIDEIQIVHIKDLLEKLGLSQEQTGTVEQALIAVLGPVVAARAKGALPTQLRELPPLTTRIPPIPSAGTQPPAHTIIDLRLPDRQAGKQQPES